eukprot:2607638-Alexandrium_andersonii.AAC.2
MEADTAKGPACLNVALSLTAPCGCSMQRSVMGTNASLYATCANSTRVDRAVPPANARNCWPTVDAGSHTCT